MDFISSYGPASEGLPNNLAEGYQPVTRINEIIQNSFIDALEFNYLDTCETDKIHLLHAETDGGYIVKNSGYANGKDKVPSFHQWATVIPGYICVQKKFNEHRFRGAVGTETAAPVIACAQCMPSEADDHFFFAGIARSKSVREFNDGRGPKTDEYFTLFVGGLATILNNGEYSIYPGDIVEWTFDSQLTAHGLHASSRGGPRRISVRAIDSPKGSHSYARAFGRAMSFAKRGEHFDVLIGSTIM